MSDAEPSAVTANSELDDEDDRNFRALRHRTKAAEAEAADLATRVAELERWQAFARAGVDLDQAKDDDPKIGYLMNRYETDLDPEKIREEAISLGVVSEGIPASELLAMQQTAAASVGAPAPAAASGIEHALAGASTYEETLAAIANAGMLRLDGD